MGRGPPRAALRRTASALLNRYSQPRAKPDSERRLSFDSARRPTNIIRVSVRPIAWSICGRPRPVKERIRNFQPMSDLSDRLARSSWPHEPLTIGPGAAGPVALPASSVGASARLADTPTALAPYRAHGGL